MAAKHFLEQRAHAESYLIPYLERHCPGFRSFRILDVGCAEAGLLDALSSTGVYGTGLEPEQGRIADSRRFNPGLNIIHGSITDPEVVRSFETQFDLVILRDVIEHITNKEIVLNHIKTILQDDGFIYITFPPRYSPFAGHQQNGTSFLRRIPFIQLLPAPIIRALGIAAGEEKHIIEMILTQKLINPSIRQFERLVASQGLQFHRKELFLFRPVFKVRYGLPTVRMADIPGLREIFGLGCECLLQKAAHPGGTVTGPSLRSSPEEAEVSGWITPV